MSAINTDGVYELPTDSNVDSLVQFLNTRVDWTDTTVLNFVRVHPTQVKALLDHLPMSVFMSLYNKHGFLKTYMTKTLWTRMISKSHIRAGITRNMSEYMHLDKLPINEIKARYGDLKDLYVASNTVLQWIYKIYPQVIYVYYKSKYIRPLDVAVPHKCEGSLLAFVSQHGVTICDREYHKNAFDILYGGKDNIIMDIDSCDIYCTASGYQRLFEPTPTVPAPKLLEIIHRKSFPAKRYRPIYINQRCCYSCKIRFDDTTVYGKYSHMCLQCGAFNHEHLTRTLRTDSSQMRVLVTGVRHKIGLQIALQLLRTGATVIGTTRFVSVATHNYSSQPDWNNWKHRLVLVKCDYTRLLEVEAIVQLATVHKINCFINCACQTVRSSPSYIQRLTQLETRLITSGPQESKMNKFCDIVDYDIKTVSSWQSQLEQVDPTEILEVSTINQVVPTLLIQRLIPVILSGFIIQVTAVEGQFYASKQATHPHTNMCKAAMNMLIRTLSEDKKSQIRFHAIDPGFVSGVLDIQNEDYPLDAEDGAARILQPIVAHCDGVPLPRDWIHLKDYKPTSW